ncbi:MAG: hypothetical protein N3D11_14770 [Candidatus Sumerlaeia bacterium]|nr:hypothetical protein [Candidatus Sumerlaeia bacterium]
MNGKHCFRWIVIYAAMMMPIDLRTFAQPTADITTIEITGNVLVRDTVPFGINLGGDAYYSGAAVVKKRVEENFEGTLYRQCHFGPVQDETGATTWFGRVGSAWDEILQGGQFTILSGPAKGTTGTIRAITTKRAVNRGEEQDFRYFVFDRKVAPGGANVGVLVESFRIRDGQFRPLDGYWTSKTNRIEIGDVPPGSFGCAAACLDGSQGRAHHRFATHYQRYGETNGTWHARFWTKARSGSPALTVRPDRAEWGDSAKVAVKPDWQKHELTLAVRNVPEPKGPNDNPHLTFVFEVSGGAILLDDVEMWMEGDVNPTVFRDDCVAVLKQFGPGLIRYLQMGGNTLDNTLSPPLRAYSYSSQNTARLGPYENHSQSPFSLHQMYELCEYLGTNPWYCLPGTLSYGEMKNFMEYLGAPANVGYGRVRAALGHPKPWTEVFRFIHVEFGNEAWNNAGPYQCGGFNGDDYWKDLIAIGKSSPYYKPNVVFHAAGQAANSWLNEGIIRRVPNADCFSVAPYIIQSLSKEEAAALDTDDKLFRWDFAWPVWRSRNKDGAMFQNFQLAQKAGMELSIYEVNHHITNGDGPLEPRNRIVTSLGGGLTVANNMLLMLKEHRLRHQALFSLVQHSYNAQGIGPVRLWGTALNMRKGHERFRPTFLACATANRVLGGDLVETRHSGADPKFSATGIFSRKGVETLTDIPTLWSYAFVQDRKRCMILVNLDTAKPQRVAIRFAGAVANNTARRWLLAADSIAANNEFENPAPQVAILEDTVADFASGKVLTLPPHSMTALAWQAQP